jgi:hypothetical protein
VCFWVAVNAQGGLARLAQARQDRPGKGGTGLDKYSYVKNLTGFRETLNEVGFTLPTHQQQ